MESTRRQHQIDHVMVDRRYASHVLDIHAKRGANVDLDHFFSG